MVPENNKQSKVEEIKKDKLQQEIDDLVQHALWKAQIPLPKVEVAPKSVIIHFPINSQNGLVWQGMQLTSDEASAFGFKMLEAAEVSDEKKPDA
jgi:hypothetical protein